MKTKKLTGFQEYYKAPIKQTKKQYRNALYSRLCVKADAFYGKRLAIFNTLELHYLFIIITKRHND